MGEYIDYLRAWFKSKPTSLDFGSFVQVLKMTIRAMEENEKDTAKLQAQVDALNAALAVLENQMAVGAAKIAKLESDVSILKG